MDEKERLALGMKTRRKVLGATWVDRADKNRNAFNSEWQDFITRSPWGEIWTRPHFDERTRRVLVMGTMIALGRWEEFKLHVSAALTEAGFTADDIKEIAAAGGLLRRAGRQPCDEGRRGSAEGRQQIPRLNRSSLCLRMIFSENRFPLFGIMR